MNNNNFIDDLNWRYATKAFDNSKKLTQEQLDYVTEAFRLTPSSYGLQPWKLIVIKDQETKAKLLPLAYGQSQIVDCSELLVLCAKTTLNDEYIDNYQREVEERAGALAGSMDGFGRMMKGSVAKLSSQDLIVWNKRQVYIALGQVMAACAAAQIDCCPMEGFSIDGFNDELGLKEKGLTAAVILPVGFRSEADKNSKKVKFRFDKKAVVEII